MLLILLTLLFFLILLMLLFFLILLMLLMLLMLLQPAPSLSTEMGSLGQEVEVMAGEKVEGLPEDPDIRYMTVLEECVNDGSFG